jgi:hypothetical protein
MRIKMTHARFDPEVATLILKKMDFFCERKDA